MMKRRPVVPLSSDGKEENVIPPNLKRKVVARRPLRGNVVPRKFRTKKGKNISTQCCPIGYFF